MKANEKLSEAMHYVFSLGKHLFALYLNGESLPHVAADGIIQVVKDVHDHVEQHRKDHAPEKMPGE